MGSVAAYFVYVALDHPARDWDMVPYVMAILNDGTREIPELHAATWNLIKARIPEEAFRLLSTGDSFREKLHADAAAMHSQLPLFESKYGYVLLGRAVSWVSDPTAALVWISLFAALTVLAVLFHQTYQLEGIAVLTWLPIVKLLGLSALSNFPTPDAIATAATVVGLWLLLAGRLGSAVVLMVLGAFLRPDNVVLNVMLCGVIFSRSVRAAVLLGICSLAVYAINVRMGAHPGWWVHFHYNFLSWSADMRGFEPPFDLMLYFEVLKVQFMRLYHHDWVFLALLAFILAGAFAKGPDRKLVWALLAAIAATFVCRFVLYPSTEARIYSPLLFSLAVLAFHASRKSAAMPSAGGSCPTSRDHPDPGSCHSPMRAG